MSRMQAGDLTENDSFGHYPSQDLARGALVAWTRRMIVIAHETAVQEQDTAQGDHHLHDTFPPLGPAQEAQRVLDGAECPGRGHLSTRLAAQAHFREDCPRDYQVL
jgi:hypothetical protein